MERRSLPTEFKLTGISLVGRPGCGKSTFGRAIESENVIYVAAGDCARKLQETDAETRYCLSHGLPAPEQKMRDMIYEILSGYVADGKQVILDGFPRTYDQVMWLEHNHFDFIYFHLMVDEDVCRERLLKRAGGRLDDNIDAINSRMQFFNKETLSMLDHAHHVIEIANFNSRDLNMQLRFKKQLPDLIGPISIGYHSVVHDNGIGIDITMRKDDK
jgi:adenylate kinase family enzyme